MRLQNLARCLVGGLAISAHAASTPAFDAPPNPNPGASPAVTVTLPPVSIDGTAPVAAVSPSATPVATASPTPVIVSATSTPIVSGTETPVPAQSATPLPSPTPSLLKKTGVKLQFLPPPMDGTISLGIYDHTGKLVRTLHKEAKGDEFVAALDGYITHWDGLDDAGNLAPPGRYAARGYLVGSAVNIRITYFMGPGLHAGDPLDSNAFAAWSSNGFKGAAISRPLVGGSASGASTPAPQHPDYPDLESAPLGIMNDHKDFSPKPRIHVVLVSNPLDRDRAGNANLFVTTDSTGSWLCMGDGLRLKQINSVPNLKWAAIGRETEGGPIVVFESDGSLIARYEITKPSSMMAFDCGPFDLPAK